jgi:hypothetical protein
MPTKSSLNVLLVSARRKKSFARSIEKAAPDFVAEFVSFLRYHHIFHFDKSPFLTTCYVFS